MKKELKSIDPTVGLGQLKFGMTRDDVKRMLGEPNDVDTYSFSGSDEDLSESWHYDDLDLSMSFDQEDDYRLITIAVSSEYYEMGGKNLVGKKRDEVLAELKSAGMKDLEFEDGDVLDMPNHKLISSPSLFINFWLEDDVLREIQWSPEFTDDDEILWPED